jgi:F-type H+-transporting ATPase subunit gamma
MRREFELRRRQRSLALLAEAVAAMKALSAQHLHRFRRELPQARSYRDGVDSIVGAANLQLSEPDHAPVRLLVVSSDIGLCGGYNSEVAEAALHCRDELAVESYSCVGRRAIPRLSGLSLVKQYRTPTSVEGLTREVLEIAEDLVQDYVEGRFGQLYSVSARFNGVGSFSVVRTQVIPAPPPSKTSRPASSPYVSTRRLAFVALREYLYITLYEILLDALAAEYGARLVATDSASQWLDEKGGLIARRLAAVRRESSTQEVLEIASAGSARRRRHDRLVANNVRPPDSQGSPNPTPI